MDLNISCIKSYPSLNLIQLIFLKAKNYFIL